MIQHAVTYASIGGRPSADAAHDALDALDIGPYTIRWADRALAVRIELAERDPGAAAITQALAAAATEGDFRAAAAREAARLDAIADTLAYIKRLENARDDERTSKAGDWQQLIDKVVTKLEGQLGAGDQRDIG